ncbi:MAG: DUF6036 family nucleotidyltransferase [Steroidobacteraceae bacterium]
MPRKPVRDAPLEPWRSFLRELDKRLTKAIELHCVGGFVVAQHYGVGRETSDIDFLSVVPRNGNDEIEAIAGLQSELHRKYRLYTQHVTIATAPTDYPSRLARMFPSTDWKHLALSALEAHDLALSKLERNNERDRDDVLRLARAGHLNGDTLRSRYFEEMQPYLLGNVDWHDKTLELWLEMCWPTTQEGN